MRYIIVVDNKELDKAPELSKAIDLVTQTYMAKQVTTEPGLPRHYKDRGVVALYTTPDSPMFLPEYRNKVLMIVDNELPYESALARHLATMKKEDLAVLVKLLHLKNIGLI